jgi:hypothetical protein
MKFIYRLSVMVQKLDGETKLNLGTWGETVDVEGGSLSIWFDRLTAELGESLRECGEPRSTDVDVPPKWGT